MNPIEHMWAWIKEWLVEHYPELKTQGQREDAYAAMHSTIKEAWEAIPQEKIDILIGSISRRINTLIKAKEWQTKY